MNPIYRIYFKTLVSLGVLFLHGFAPSVGAQPRENEGDFAPAPRLSDAEQKRQASLAREWKTLQEQTETLEAQDLARALEIYRAFGERSLDFPALSVEVALKMARLMAIAGGDKEGALSLLDAMRGAFGPRLPFESRVKMEGLRRELEGPAHLEKVALPLLTAPALTPPGLPDAVQIKTRSAALPAPLAAVGAPTLNAPVPVVAPANAATTALPAMGNGQVAVARIGEVGAQQSAPARPDAPLWNVAPVGMVAPPGAGVSPLSGATLPPAQLAEKAATARALPTLVEKPATTFNPFAAPARATVETATPSPAKLQTLAFSERAQARSRIAGVLQQLLVGEIEVETAFAGGALSGEDVPPLVEDFISHWGNFLPGEKQDVALRRALVARWVNANGELPKDWPKWSQKLRLWSADYLQSIGDRRCLELCESILKEMPKPLPKADDAAGDLPMTFQAIERMGWFYDAAREHQKCADTWLRVADYCPQQGWWKGDMWLLAARSLDKTGKPNEAKRLRHQVPSVGQGWITALALYDEALPLIAAGKLAEARAILERPLQANAAEKDGLIAQNAWLANLAYQQGDLDAAFRYGQKAVEVMKDGYKLPNDSVRNLYNLAFDVFNRAGGWKTQPIQSDVQTLLVQTNSSSPTYARFCIKTYGDIQVSAQVDSSDIQVRVLPLDNWKGQGLNAQEEQSEVIVQVPSKYVGHEKKHTYIISLRSETRVEISTDISVVVRFG